MFKCQCFVAIIILLMTPIKIARAIDATGNASAVIREQITVTQTRPLDFGIITVDPGGASVRIQNNSNMVLINGTATFSGTSTSAQFRATGDPNAAITTSFSSGNILSGSGNDIPLVGLARNGGNSPSFDGSGIFDFTVRGRLNIGANQTGGSYAGTYTVTVNYQ